MPGEVPFEVLTGEPDVLPDEDELCVTWGVFVVVVVVYVPCLGAEDELRVPVGDVGELPVPVGVVCEEAVPTGVD